MPRADALLAERGLFESRAKAREAIEAGLVFADGRPVKKPSEEIAADAALNAQAPYPWVEIHPQTAERLGIADGDWVTVRTRRGEMTAPALVVRSIRPDTLFIPYHYGHTQAVNQLTNPVLEPMMKIPEYKVCAAVAIRSDLKPDWAVEETTQDMLNAARHRHELPAAQAQPQPGLH